MTSQQRLRRLLTGLLLVAAAGVGYALWVTLTHLAIPCPFHAVTGLWCPGCGVTRMCLALLRLDLAEAWQANPVLLVLLPLIAGLLGYRMVCYVRQGHTPAKRWETLAWSGLAVVLVIWGIVRNVV
ncbi:DUF2752 domain-containing protein [Pseudoflavonifractor sp. An85]|uniref:DUF2752 domain-containing protein n=1 Tax=Pseudoflavonifractor sp. An85 TaxID=1965661 RepID=UPI000B3A5968|nr:DUF2752 domain-containing protein [Pseudoflavonifractor sp. An85]OUN19942.1 hypothetical protein B5G37_13275 [Pseudoflavonifractor sp. An85]